MKSRIPNKREAKSLTLTKQNPTVIKLLQIFKGKVYASSLSINKAFEMKKIQKLPDSTPESPRDNKIWVAKMTLGETCNYEVIGQEGMRLFSVVKQPKTRFLDHKGKIGVISEKLPFHGLEMTEKKKSSAFTKEFLKGLGASTLLSLFFNETDLKPDHIDQTTGLKIDGDWMLSSLSQPSFKKNTVITEKDIDHLPYVHDYKANNWLDQIVSAKTKKGELLFDCLTPVEKKMVREGINISILRVILLPENILKNFVNSYINNPDIQNKIYTYLIERKKQLLDESLKNTNFLDFLREDAEKKKGAYVENLRTFITHKKNNLIQESDYPKIKKEIYGSLKLIQAKARAGTPAISIDKPKQKRFHH